MWMYHSYMYTLHFSKCTVSNRSHQSPCCASSNVQQIVQVRLFSKFTLSYVYSLSCPASVTRSPCEGVKDKRPSRMNDKYEVFTIYCLSFHFISPNHVSSFLQVVSTSQTPVCSLMISGHKNLLQTSETRPLSLPSNDHDYRTAVNVQGAKGAKGSEADWAGRKQKKCTEGKRRLFPTKGGRKINKL